MNIAKLFSTEERVKILENVIFREREFGVNEIAKQLNLSKGLVSKYFEILVNECVLGRKRRKFYVQNNILVRSLKILFNLQKIDPKIFRKYKFVRAAGIYGSSVKGTNTESSDVDLWVKVEKLKEESGIIKLASELRRKIRNVKVLFLDGGKIRMLREKDPLFYYSLYFGSIIIYGEEGEI